MADYLLEALRRGAKETEEQQVNGWGNTMSAAAQRIERQALRISDKAVHVIKLQKERDALDLKLKKVEREKIEWLGRSGARYYDEQIKSLNEDNAKQSKRIKELETELKQATFGKGPDTEKDLLICDGCNVRKPHEHRCHRSPITQYGVMLEKACECLECREADRATLPRGDITAREIDSD